MTVATIVPGQSVTVGAATVWQTINATVTGVAGQPVGLNLDIQGSTDTVTWSSVTQLAIRGVGTASDMVQDDDVAYVYYRVLQTFIQPATATSTITLTY